jgi:hypothetical protein
MPTAIARVETVRCMYAPSKSSPQEWPRLTALSTFNQNLRRFATPAAVLGKGPIGQKTCSPPAHSEAESRSTMLRV